MPTSFQHGVFLSHQPPMNYNNKLSDKEQIEDIWQHTEKMLLEDDILRQHLINIWRLQINQLLLVHTGRSVFHEII
jgi:hypothetical protein